MFSKEIFFFNWKANPTAKRKWYKPCITTIFMSNVTYFFLDCQLPEDQTWLCWQLFSEVFTIPWLILSNHVAAAGKNKAPETIILIK